MGRSLNIDQMHIGETFTHPIYGNYTIMQCVGKRGKQYMVKIKFANTGFEKEVTLNHAINGSVKDPYCITCYGVGYLGEYETADDIYRIRPIWTAMMSRCYNPNDKDYHLYGGRGITVDPRWHNFANFLNDFRNFTNYDKWRIHKRRFGLDKDILQANIPLNQRVYGPDTCQLIDSIYNTSFGATGELPEGSRFRNVHRRNNNYYTKMKMDGRFHQATFDNDYYASVYRETILDNRNLGAPVPTPVPTTIEAFKEAQEHRISGNNNGKFIYKKMYTVVDKEKGNV